MKRRFVMVLALCCLIAAGLSMWPPAQAAEQSGTCGANLTWTLDARGNLTISGTGDMKEGTHPWSSYGSSIRTVVIEDGITSIADSAFYNDSDNKYGYNGISRLTIGSSVDTIGSYAFYGWKGLRELTIPDSVVKIYYGAFEYCTALESVTLSNNLDLISGSLFSGCTSLHAIQVPPSVSGIESYAFSGCSSLKNAAVLGNVSEIKSSAFHNCSRLQNITFNGLDIIRSSAFSGCSHLSDVFYSGSQTDWNGLYIEEDNGPLKAATLHPDFKAEATLVVLDKETIELERGDSAFLTATLYPESASSEPIRWASSDNAVAEVKDGKILAKQAGTVTITAETLDHRLSAACEVAVTSPVPEGQFTVNSLSVKTDGGTLDTIPTGSFMASVSVTNTTASDAPYVVLAAYGTGSQFVSLMYVKVDATPGGTVEVMLPVDNSSGEITQLKAFAVSGDGSMIPSGPSASFAAQ